MAIKTVSDFLEESVVKSPDTEFGVLWSFLRIMFLVMLSIVISIGSICLMYAYAPVQSLGYVEAAFYADVSISLAVSFYSITAFRRSRQNIQTYIDVYISNMETERESLGDIQIKASGGSNVSIGNEDSRQVNLTQIGDSRYVSPNLIKRQFVMHLLEFREQLVNNVRTAKRNEWLTNGNRPAFQFRDGESCVREEYDMICNVLNTFGALPGRKQGFEGEIVDG